MGGVASGGMALDKPFTQNTVDTESSKVPGMSRIEPANKDESFLLHKLKGTQNIYDNEAQGGNAGARMPLGGPFLTDEQVEYIEAWINSL